MVRGITVQMMSAYMTVWKAGFLDVDKKSSVTVLMSPLAARYRPWDQQLWKPFRLPTVEDLTSGTSRRLHRSASRARGCTCGESVCDVVMFFSLSCFGSVSKVLSLSRLSQSVSTFAHRFSRHCILATLLSVRWPAEESDLLTEWIGCTYCASARQAKALA